MGKERSGGKMTSETKPFATGWLTIPMDKEETHIEFVRTNYATGGLAVLARNAETHEPLARLSANVEGETLPPDEFYLKTWSENAEIAQLLILTGAIRPVANVDPIQCGHVMAYRWRIVE